MAPAPSAPNPVKSSEARRNLLLLFGILCLAFAARIYHLDMLSLWRDEGFTRFYSEAPLWYLWTTGFRMETNPPLYYTVMHFWIPLFGPSEFALRSFSVIASMATILVVYALGKELGGRSLGLIGALLMAVWPTEIWYAQETRTYALLQLAISLTLLGTARYLSKASMGNLGLYAVSALAAIYLHDTALVMIAALNLAVIGSILWESKANSKSRLIRWVGVNAILALASFPLVNAMLHLSKSSNLQWIQPLTPFGFLRMVAEVIGGPAANREFLEGRTLSYLLLFGTALALLYFRKLERRSVAILVLVPVFFVALGVLINFYTPILIPRVLTWTLIPLSLLIAHVLIHVTRVRPFLFILLAGVLVIGLDAQFFPSFSAKENWREVIAKNWPMISKADVIVLGSSTPPGCFIYYAPDTIKHRFRHPGQLYYWHPDNDRHKLTFAHIYSYDVSAIHPLETAQVIEAIKSGKRVCLILGGAPQINLTKSGLLPKPDYLFADEFLTEYDINVLAWNYTDSSVANKMVIGN